IGEAEFGEAPARGGGAGGRDDGARSALCARGARDRGANETHSDQRQTIEDGLPPHLRPTNSASAATTSRFASSLPTVMRIALGGLWVWPGRRMGPRWERKAWASPGGRPGWGGRWMSTNLAMLGVPPSPSLRFSPPTQARHFSLCARDAST